jgi:hypothetical protein
VTETTRSGSVFSRHYEHQADMYDLEFTHGLMPD